MSITSPSGSADCHPCILVAGPAHVGKTSLCQGITNSRDAPRQSSSIWTIRTKYYSATVDVREATVSPELTAGQPEALVLVFSLAAPDTFNSLQAFCDQLDLEAVEVKLLCGTHADILLDGDEQANSLETPSQPAWFQQVSDWSIQHGFEFIICCPAVPTVDAALALDGDQQGLARIIEALHAHTWPNLDMLPQSQMQSTISATHLARDAPSEGASTDIGRGPSEEQREQGSQGEPQGLNAVAVSVGEHMPGGGQGQDTEDGSESADAERMLDGLERLMDDIKGHKARLSTLPDDERREQAAALALRMLEVLGFESGSDDD